MSTSSQLSRGTTTTPSNPDIDLADRAIEWITGHGSLKPEDPFLMLWASGSMHSRHHASPGHIEKHGAKFDMGWDVARKQILVE